MMNGNDGPVPPGLTSLFFGAMLAFVGAASKPERMECTRGRNPKRNEEIMKRTPWILTAIICILILTSCSQNPLDPTSNRQVQLIQFPAQHDDPAPPTIPPPTNLNLETDGCFASLCWCAQGSDCTYACRIYRSIDGGEFELMRTIFCSAYCEDISELQFEKVSWFVTNVSSRGVESEPSRIVSVKVLLPDEWFPVEQD